jgi:hypothetical protein
LEPFKETIDGWLRDDLDAPRKQRHTAKRVFDRLTDVHDGPDVSYSTVRDHVARRRREIAAEAGRGLDQGFVPQTHEPGGEAEVDFADLWVVLRGVKTKTLLFTLRLSYSGKSVRAATRVILPIGTSASPAAGVARSTSTTVTANRNPIVCGGITMTATSNSS